MNRRIFLSTMAALPLAADESKQKILLPTDQPDALGFRIMWYAPGPPIDQAGYKLQVGGLVERPLSFTLADLRKLPQETQSARLRCIQGWSSRTDWGGFRFAALTDLVKPQPEAKAIRIDCADKWYEYFSLEEASTPRFLFALDMAGQPLSDQHGAPLRVVDPSKYGYKSAKLVTAVTFVEKGKWSMACDLGPYYSPHGNLRPGYDTPLDLDGKKRKVGFGEITEY